MALNSLYPDGWFALGAAALKVIYVICISVNSLFNGVLHPNICKFCRFYQNERSNCIFNSIYQKFLKLLLKNCCRLEMLKRLWMGLLVLFSLILKMGRLGIILLVCMLSLLQSSCFQCILIYTVFCFLISIQVNIYIHKKKKRLIFKFCIDLNFCTHFPSLNQRFFFFGNYHDLPPFGYYNSLLHDKRINAIRTIPFACIRHGPY